ncbi:MAG TPA: biotin/lipoyl-binding protein, partial [Hyphomicrobiales bacterium]|nr:biotin/lipoyl-binding protein [Hyphomicrobiales bacterium]
MRRGRILLFIALLIGAGAGYWWYRKLSQNSGELVLQGNVEVRQVNLGFKVAGRIEHLYVDEGDPVHAGQVLASL